MPPEEDEQGWSRWQLHYVMNKFGELCYSGLNAPFKTNIIINPSEEIPDQPVGASD